MKRIATILVMLPALFVSCQKTETKDEEQKRLLIGTWVSEGYDKVFGAHWQFRQIIKSDGTVQWAIYRRSGYDNTKPKKHESSLVRHRYLRAIGKDDTLPLPQITTETWRIENGTIFRTPPENVEFVWGIIKELTETRLVFEIKGIGIVTYIKLSHWNSMTDAEIMEYYEDNEIKNKLYGDNLKKEWEKKKQD